jgi:hypothetical protein
MSFAEPSTPTPKESPALGAGLCPLWDETYFEANC